ARGCGSGIRWSARRPTGRHRSRRGRSCTARWPRPPTRWSILIGGAWPRARAGPGPDEEVAAELEQCAGRAQRRGGLAAAAAFLERSAGLMVDPARRARRALGAAAARHRAGASDAALGLLATAQAGPLDELQRARGDLLRAQIAFA